MELELNFDAYSETELLAAVTQRVGAMLEQEQDMLMSFLYRLDVEEKAILKALNPGPNSSVAHELALLILERQKQRWVIKQQVNVDKKDIPEGWEW